MFLVLLACTGEEKAPTSTIMTTPEGEEIANVFVDAVGDPVPWLDGELLTQYESGRLLMSKAFTPEQGLGPTFNADSCGSCHQTPVVGGSAPRYRDLWLVSKERWDGAMVPTGTNGASPVRNLYAVPPIFHVPIDPETSQYTRRNTPSGFGVGLFSFIMDETIVALADPEDEDGNGISGRLNFEQGEVGRFGYKAQAATLESFNRGALINQMGITSDPLFYTLPAVEIEEQRQLEEQQSWWDFLLQTAWAQVSAPNEPTLDDDAALDPEISNAEQEDILVFSIYLGVPRPSELGEQELLGKALFSEVGCADCHLPTITSTIGAIPAYTDLLLHDMGEDLSDGMQIGFASATEFRTQPLWGVSMHGPFLHDGRADTLSEAIEWHGGEANSSRSQWLALSEEEQAQLLAFLDALGGEPLAHNNFITADTPVPLEGEAGAPREGLSAEEREQWIRGRYLFDRDFQESEGLGEGFNADSCRACHQDPVIGGAGGNDVNVLRYGFRDLETGEYQALHYASLSRSALNTFDPAEIEAEANVVEARNPPSLLGLGLLGEIAEEIIVANADPDDEDGDGISGRVRWVGDGSQLGRYSWKAAIPTLRDFTADALLQEIGITVDSTLSDFTIENDNDEQADPELSTDPYQDLVFYLENLAPPPRKELSAAGQAGEELFGEIGCASCHLPELGGVSAYTDLLLHDIAQSEMTLVAQDPGILPTEFRTPPLWGISHTAPYLHDGAASTIEGAILQGHFREATSAREAYEALSAEEKTQILTFLEAL